MAFKDEFVECAAFAESIRDVFGDGVKLIYASEAGKVVETKTSQAQAGMVEINSEQYLAMGELSRRNAEYANRRKR